MKYASDILLHFVARAHRDDPDKVVEICTKVLTEGFLFTPQSLQIGATGIALPFAITPEAVCFTDIPLRLSGAHVSRYGTCAIGVTKARVKTWGGNPVQYFVDSTLPHHLTNPEHFRGAFGEQIARILAALAVERDAFRKTFPSHWVNQLDDEGYTSAKRDLIWALASHLKPMFDLGPDVDSEDEAARRDRYYMEREWRVALTDGHKNHAKVHGNLVREVDGRFFLSTARKEVRIVVVPNERVGRTLATNLRAAGWSDNELPPIIPHADTLDL
jgi:hypothetical protein